MGTQQLPDSKFDRTERPAILEDIPRIGPIMWVMLGAFLLPPILVTLVGNLTGAIPNQKFWVVLLGIPIPFILFILPRKYTIDDNYLTVIGFFYRVRIRRDGIHSVKPVGTWQALFHGGSMFCSDPGRALKLVRTKGRVLVISPRNPVPFLRLAKDSSETKRVEP